MDLLARQLHFIWFGDVPYWAQSNMAHLWIMNSDWKMNLWNGDSLVILEKEASDEFPFYDEMVMPYQKLFFLSLFLLYRIGGVYCNMYLVPLIKFDNLFPMAVSNDMTFCGFPEDLIYSHENNIFRFHCIDFVYEDKKRELLQSTKYRIEQCLQSGIGTIEEDHKRFIVKPYINGIIQRFFNNRNFLPNVNML